MFVTKLGHYPIILSIPWMKLPDVAIHFSSCTLTFGSQYCIAHYNPVPTMPYAITSEFPEPALCSLVSKVGPCGPAKTTLNGTGYGLDTHTALQLNATGPRLDAHTRPELNGTRPGLDGHAESERDARPLWIAALGGCSFRCIAHKELLTVFLLSLYEINHSFKLEGKQKQVNLADHVSKEYHKLLLLFSEAVAKALPMHLPYAHKIPLREGFTPPFGLVYSLSKTELQALKE